MALLSSRLFNKSLLSRLSGSLKALSVSSHQLQKPEIANSSKTSDENIIKNNVFENITNAVSKCNIGRLFAVVHLCGKQFKVTSGDIIIVEGYWPPTTNDRIRLEKVLLVGGNNFTLFGRPILEHGLVDVHATVIEKTLSHTKTHFKKKRRKQYLRINFQRSPTTMLRITSIELPAKINETTDTRKSSQIF